MATKTNQGASTSSPDLDVNTDRGSKGLKDAAGGVAEEAGKTVEKTAAKSMAEVGDALHQVAQAVRQSGENLQTEQPQVARFVSTAADKVDEAATYVSNHEPRELMDGAQNVARQQPALVVGAGLVAGILIGRVLRSAGGPSSSGESGQDWYGTGYRGNGRPGRMSTGPQTGYGTGYDRPRLGTTGTTSAERLGSERAMGSAQSRSNGGSDSNPVEG